MGGKTPQDVFLPAYLPQADAIGIHIVHLAQDPVLEQGLQLTNGRMVFEDMPYHEDAPGGLGQLDQVAPCA